MVLNGEQEKESIIHVRVEMKNPSLVIIICHHSASLVMPNGHPRDGFFYPTFILMMDSYNPRDPSLLSFSKGKMMTKGDTWDGFFYPPLTVMMKPYKNRS